jgi:hypothetical protein
MSWDCQGIVILPLGAELQIAALCVEVSLVAAVPPLRHGADYTKRRPHPK